jgi:archaellin
MHTLIAFGLIAAVVAYVALQLLIHATQHKGEPRLLESKLPFIDSAIGILKHRANYLSKLRRVMHVTALYILLTVV